MPKWHDYRISYYSFLEGDEDFDGLMARFGRAIPRLPTQAHKTAMINSRCHFISERNWEKDKRPYYNVYPSVTEALSKVDLSKVKCEHIKLPIEIIMIRFQIGHELHGIHSILAANSVVYNRPGIPGIVLAADNGESTSLGGPNTTTTALSLIPGESIQDRLDAGRMPGVSLNQGVDNDMMDAAYRLICSLCLLRDNPDLINQEPLDADRAKYDATHDPSLLDKAARRGKRCWSIGKFVEVAPGFRHPHFAVRWMGKRPDLQPVVRPIKGCLVNRKKIEGVPTGFLDVPLEAIVVDD